MKEDWTRPLKPIVVVGRKCQVGEPRRTRDPVVSSGQGMWHPPWARAAAHLGLEYLEGQGCNSSTRTQLNHQLQRCACKHHPGATPLPKLESRGEKGKKNERWRGSWRKLVFTITIVGAAVVRLIHPGLLTPCPT